MSVRYDPKEAPPTPPVRVTASDVVLDIVCGVFAAAYVIGLVWGVWFILSGLLF